MKSVSLAIVAALCLGSASVAHASSPALPGSIWIGGSYPFLGTPNITKSDGMHNPTLQWRADQQFGTVWDLGSGFSVGPYVFTAGEFDYAGLSWNNYGQGGVGIRFHKRLESIFGLPSSAGFGDCGLEVFVDDHFSQPRGGVGAQVRCSLNAWWGSWPQQSSE